MCNYDFKILKRYLPKCCNDCIHSEVCQEILERSQTALVLATDNEFCAYRETSCDVTR